MEIALEPQTVIDLDYTKTPKQYHGCAVLDSRSTIADLRFANCEFLRNLEIISGWKAFVKGTFYVVRYLKACAIFLSSDTVAKTYGVRGLYCLFEEVGKMNAKRDNKRLREMGVMNAWFGILDGIIIASGKSK